MKKEKQLTIMDLEEAYFSKKLVLQQFLDSVKLLSLSMLPTLLQTDCLSDVQQ